MHIAGRTGQRAYVGSEQSSLHESIVIDTISAGMPIAITEIQKRYSLYAVWPDSNMSPHSCFIAKPAADRVFKPEIEHD